MITFLILSIIASIRFIINVNFNVETTSRVFCRIADAIEVKKADLEGHIRSLTLEDIDQFPGSLYLHCQYYFFQGSDIQLFY